MGALVVLDPFATAYLLNLPYLEELRKLPFVISISAALLLGIAFAMRPYMAGLTKLVIYDYWRAFPLVFIFAYQLSGMRAGPLDAAAVVIVAFILLFLAALFIRGDKQTFVSSPLNVLNIALVGCIILSLVMDFKPYGLLKSMKAFLLFFLLVNFLPREDVILSFLRWLMVFGILSALFGFVQELGWALFQEMWSFAPEEGLKRSIETYFGMPIFRIPAMMISYASLATYLGAALVFSLSSLLWPSDKPLLPRRWLWFSVFVFAAAIGLTIAKPVMIGIFLGVSLLLVLHRPMRLVPAAAAGALGVLGLALIIAIIPGNIDTIYRYADEIPKTEQERIRLDRESIDWIMHSPYTWIGRGTGSGSRYTSHTLRWPAHNAFILVTAELGVVGLAVYLLIYATVFARAILLNIRIRDGPYLPVVRGTLAALVIVLVGAQFEAVYLDIFVWTLFATVEAIWIRLHGERGNPAPAPAVTAAST